jgi:O-6-methylguanine DNA methyltransferase
MKDHARSSGKKGRPAYRTPSQFQAKVYAATKKIPRGKTATYKEIAHMIDQPRAYRAVGNALNKNDDPTVPCHRVVRSDGSIGGYNRGAEKKKDILDAEKRSQ